MPRALWSGYLTFGLVSFPVELVPAARRKTIDFDLLHRKDHSRIRQVIYCQTEDKPLKRDELVKGFEYEKDKFVVFEPEEIKAAAPAAAKVMEIQEFVDATEIDPIYFDTSYYLLPGEGGTKPYALLFAAMRETNYSAIAKLGMHNREYTVVLRCGDNGLRLHTMFYADEIREASEFDADSKRVAAKELTLAKSLIKSLAGEFDPSQYHDAYRERLEEMIQAKMKGKKIVATPAPKVGKVVDIVAALKKSLENAPARKPPRAANKTTARRKAS